MNGPWTWTTVWGIIVGMGGGLGGGGKRGKNWDNCKRITIKYFFKKRKWQFSKAKTHMAKNEHSKTDQGEKFSLLSGQKL